MVNSSVLGMDGYLNCQLSCSCIISPDLGLPTQVQRAEHLPVADSFIWRGLNFFSKVLASSIVKTTVQLIRDKRAFKVYTNFYQNINHYYLKIINATQLCSNHCSLNCSLAHYVTVPMTCVDFKIQHKNTKSYWLLNYGVTVYNISS